MPVTRQRQQSAALRQAEPVNSLPRCLSSRELLGAAPYLATVIAVAGFVGRVRPPAADGEPYVKS